ncbi:MAG: pyrroline-5-carboxylate reductase [Steroidobacteraceae bacterium]|nr:pyrroline-5-carboxylate reductase [Steroidobacteraceae bacterium]MDW8259275.1 pyrroline-5-carboxylate reductase [Gammaproteobacteria bacterium]
MPQTRIACLGGGNMGRALLAALVRAGHPRDCLTVGEPNSTVRANLQRDLGIAAYADNAAAVAGAEVVILAVKPQDAAATLTPLRAPLAPLQPLLLSIVAGLRCADLEHWSGPLPIVRAMPNRPALVGAGASGLYAPPAVSTRHRELATYVMQSAGTVVWLESEAQLNAVTAVSGSGPAYFFLLAEALVGAAIAQGLSEPVARRLAIATLYGAGVMAAQSDGDLTALRAAVTSKGGTTAAALEILDGATGLRPLVAAAVDAAVRRGTELARAFGAPDGAGRG